jgi:hypothetical protein
MPTVRRGGGWGVDRLFGVGKCTRLAHHLLAFVGRQKVPWLLPGSTMALPISMSSCASPYDLSVYISRSWRSLCSVRTTGCSACALLASHGEQWCSASGRLGGGRYRRNAGCTFGLMMVIAPSIWLICLHMGSE